MSLVALETAVLALAGGAGVGGATPMPLASKHDRLVTDDRWTLDLNASELVVNPTSNIANSASSLEGWVSSKVNATISGAGTQPVQSAILEQFLVVGCQVDVSDGATLGLGFSIANEGFANDMGMAHERDGGNLGTRASDMGLSNNEVGRRVGLLGESKPDSWIYQTCVAYAKDGTPTVLERRSRECSRE